MMDQPTHMCSPGEYPSFWPYALRSWLQCLLAVASQEFDILYHEISCRLSKQAWSIYQKVLSTSTSLDVWTSPSSSSSFLYMASLSQVKLSIFAKFLVFPTESFLTGIVANELDGQIVSMLLTHSHGVSRRLLWYGFSFWYKKMKKAKYMHD